MKYPNYECPRFQKCGVNNCPLHPSYPDLYTDTEDVQAKCTLEKQVRFRIGSKYLKILKFQGLTSREYVGKQRFENLSEEERQVIRETAKERFSTACGRQLSDDGIKLPSQDAAKPIMPLTMLKVSHAHRIEVL